MRIPFRQLRRFSASTKPLSKKAGTRSTTQKPQTSTAALEQALRGEKQRSEQELNSDFERLRTLHWAKENDRTFPRRIQDKTFFTPHMQRPQANEGNSSVETEYAVVLPGQTMAIRQPSNPVRQRLSSLPKTLSQAQVESIHLLEKRGWQFIGLNGDILVFEKQTDTRSASLKQAVRAGIILTVGVTVMTSALYIGEYYTLAKS